jgi:hypothetical protein
MVETDIKGHTVPSATGESPARAAFLRLALSINDPIPVANFTERTAALAALAALSPAIVPSASKPIFFYQASNPFRYRLIYTEDGTQTKTADGVFVWSNDAARVAATGAALHDWGYQLDTRITWRYNGSTWVPWDSEWIGYTPTLTGITLGTGGSAGTVAHYRYEGGRVRVRVQIILGTSGMAVSSAVISLPATAAALRHNYVAYAGVASFYDDSASNNYTADVCANNTSTTQVILLMRGTNGLRVGVSSTVPFTWAASDRLSAEFVYDPA